MDNLPEHIVLTAEHYAASTSVPCCAADQLSSCEFCPLHSPNSNCRETHRFGALQSERFGGSYVYFCEGSLLFWTSPVLTDGKMLCSLTAGPVLVLDPEDIIEDAVHRLGSDPEKLRRALSAVPAVDISRVHHLAEVLRMCASWASGSSQGMEATRDSLEQLSRVSEVIHDLKQKGTDGSYPVYPLDKEEELRQAIRVGDKSGAQRLLNELLGIIFFSSGNSLERIKFRILELLILLSRSALEGGAPEEDIMELSFTCQREISRLSSTEAAARWLSGMLHEYTSMVFDARSIKHADSIIKALQYLHRSYREKITLKDIADHVSLSPTYFSKLFNEEMGCTVTGYINRLRITQAKSLLKNTSFNLVDIAGIVGFEDQSYFSRVFKSVTGVTPGKFRRRAGVYPAENFEIHEGMKKI